MYKEEKMKALLMNEYKKLVFTDVKVPELNGSRDLLVKIKAAAICGSDVHGFDGSTGRRIPPVIMGHEASGEIVNKGESVKDFNIGDRITFNSTIYCGECDYCREGSVNLCDNRKVIGVSCDEYRRDGTFAEYIVIPDYIAYKLPEGLTYEEAALAEPAAVAAHALKITPVDLNDSVAVVGTGLIGLLLIQILKASTSGNIIALDTDLSRLETAKTFGADYAFDPSDVKTAEKVKEICKGKGPDRVFEAVGTGPTVKTAINLVRKGGSVTLIGNIHPSIELPLQTVVTRQITLLGSCAMTGEYPAVLDLMARKKIDVKPLISAKAPLNEGQQWFERLYNREKGLLKVVLTP
jgi:threonine dehydrogenase-like Zn-dependent dehydrogenase